MQWHCALSPRFLILNVEAAVTLSNNGAHQRLHRRVSQRKENKIRQMSQINRTYTHNEVLL
jgi:hypothetical protein